MVGRLQIGLRRIALTLCALTALVTPVASSAFGAASPSQTVRIGSAPEIPAGAEAFAPLSATKPLQLTVALESPDPTGLAELASEVSDPASPRFRQYLSVAQFAQRFGATPAQLAAVRSALQAQGLTVGQPTANDLALPVSGSAAHVEQALSVSLSQLKLASGRTAYANAQAPSIAASVAPFVQGVVGLDDLHPDQPQQTARAATRAALASRRGARSASASLAAARSGNVQIATGGPQPCVAAQELQTPIEFAPGKRAAGVTADQVATAYQLASLYRAGNLGAGQTVALFEQEAFLPSDIAAFQSCYGTNASVTPINVDGGPEPVEEEDTEAALDIEQVIGLAPKVNVLVYQGPEDQSRTPVDIISQIVSENRAKIISSSWGVCEALSDPVVISLENTLLQEAAAQGQSFYAASGDSGSEQCSQFESTDHTLSVLNPASQPFATGVGGTALYSSSENGNRFYTGELPPSEGVWNDGPRALGGGGTGGGISQRWAMPSYQSGAAGLGVLKAESSAEPCASATFCREVPDVAADADPLTGYVVYATIEGEAGWTFVGGTSASAPLWAAFTGLADASAACNGVPIGFANPSLYSVAASAYASDFRDVTQASPFTGLANNDTLFGTGPYPVTTGYDMTTGLGSPIGETLAGALCALAKPVPDQRPAEAQTTVQPGPGSPTPVPTPGGARNATAVVTPARIRAQLARALAPSGNAAKLAVLLKAGGYSLSFSALEPGTLKIAWYELPRGAKLAKRGVEPKPVLVAAGRLTFATAKSATLKLKLTSAGRALLKRAGRVVALTGKSTFAPSAAAPLSATKPFLLRR